MEVDVRRDGGHEVGQHAGGHQGGGDAQRRRVTRTVGTATRWTIAGSLVATGALVAIVAHDAPGSSSHRSGGTQGLANGGASSSSSSDSAAGLTPPSAVPSPAQGLPRLSTGQS